MQEKGLSRLRLIPTLFDQFARPEKLRVKIIRDCGKNAESALCEARREESARRGNKCCTAALADTRVNREQRAIRI